MDDQNMAHDPLMAGLVPRKKVVSQKEQAALKLSMGAFEKAAHLFGQVTLYYNTSSEMLKKSLYYRHMCEDAYYFGRMVKAQTSFTEIEARLYDLEKEDYRAKPHEDPAPHSTQLTHVAHLYMAARYARNWYRREPQPSEFAGLYDVMVPLAVNQGIMTRESIIDGFKSKNVEKFFQAPALGWNLATACSNWIRHQDKFLYNPISEMVWLTMLPALVAKTGMVPYPALSFGGSFSFETYIHRPSFEEKMLYLAGVLERTALKSREKVTKSAMRVEGWTHILKDKRVKSKQIYEMLPWLTVRERFLVRDVELLLDAPRATAARMVDTLVKANIVGFEVRHNRNKIYHTQRLSSL